MKKLAYLLLAIFLLSACSNNKVEKRTLDDIINDNNYIIIDVRTKEEYDEGHVINAVNIPYDEIDETIDLDKSKDILVYCKSGKRASIAEQTLKELDYNVYNLGGYDQVPFDKE